MTTDQWKTVDDGYAIEVWRDGMLTETIQLTHRVEVLPPGEPREGAAAMTMRPIPDPDAEVARLTAARSGEETVTVLRADWLTLLAVATQYVYAHQPHEREWPDVEDIVQRHGKHYRGGRPADWRPGTSGSAG